MTLPASYRTPKSCQNRRGVALVLVLGALLILSVVLVAFLSSVTIAAKSSRAGDQNIQTRWLSETCVNLVISQIEKATTQTATCWASQPGMIRDFGTAGQPAGYYKLYSSSTMSDTAAFDPTATANQVPSTWVTDTGLYTDLNSPITDGGITYYPILDPKAIDVNTPEGSISAKAVDQFKVDQNALAVNAAPQIAAGISKVPMPVQWLYVLQDGTTVAPTGSGSAAIVAGATPANPIVSRIAFWTDDESCKVNINTASEGTYFDVPHADTIPEREFAKCQPVIGEYQRYPGHPATTSLSAVFGSILLSPTSVTSVNYPLLAKYYQLTPRVTSGGTQGGTVQTQDQLNITAVTPKLDRLYTSPDELLYTPARTVNSPGLTATDIQRLSFFLTANSRAPELNLFGRPRITIWPIHNNPLHIVPDLYQTQQDRLIAFCSQLKGDGTKPDNLYYFQRQDPHSTTFDYANIPRNQALYKYLQDATSRNIPGFGDNFVNKYTTAERDQILTEIFDYIRSSNLNDPKLPVANTYTWYFNPDPSIPFNDPHGEYANYPPYYTTAQDSPGQVVPIAITAPDTGTLTKGAGRFPVIDEATLIFYATRAPRLNAGKFETYIRCALVTSLFHPMQGFMCNLDRFKLEGTLGSAETSTFLLTPHAPLSNGGPLNFFSDAATYPGPAILWANSNAKYGTYFGRNLGGNHSIGPLVLEKTLGIGGDGQPDYRSTTAPTAQNKEEVTYTFVSKEITLQDSDSGGSNSPPLASPQWDFTGGTFKIRVLSANSGTEIQTYTFNFPSVANLPMPKGVTLPYPGISNDPTVLWYLDLNPKTQRADYASQSSGPQGDHSKDDVHRFIQSITNPQDNYQSHQNAAVLPGDVARSLQLAIDAGTSGGDQRLIAYTKDVPPEWFTPHVDYLDSTKQFAHNLREGYGFSLTGGGGGGTFINSLGTTDLTKRPWIRSELGSTADVLAPSGAPADWDTSFGAEPDGAYLDKADEGASSHEGGVPYFFAADTRFASAANLTEANRQMPSAGIFGSLPTGVKRKQPWQTLLFRPDFSGKHPGAIVNPQDHLWLDLFQMPIVTPYAISEPFSTGGKINLNYQIVPFTYITRDTGIRAVLKNERLIAIADGDKDKYKNSNQTAGSIRLTLSLDETLKSFESRFASGDIFRSASEICDIPLIPAGSTLANISTFWSTHRLTGDNLKERPYTTIYPRITTKSNVFTVHYRVQLLTKPAARLTSAPTSFDTSLGDTIAGEYRGQTIIERYLDPLDPRLPDFTADLTASADTFYKFRVLDSRQFNP